MVILVSNKSYMIVLIWILSCIQSGLSILHIIVMVMNSLASILTVCVLFF